MKHWRIWDNHDTHFKDALTKFLKTVSHKEQIILWCAEECDIGENFNYSIFKKYKNLTAVFGAYANNYNLYKTSNIILWPNYFMYHAVYTKVGPSIPTSPNNLKYLFTCMNNRPKFHRSLLMDNLEKYNLLDKNAYSWHESSDYNYQYWKEQYKTLDGKFIGQQNKFPMQMYQSCIDLITESVIDIPFLTEKTYNAILFQKPFIIFGNPNCHKYLESIGYKLPRNVIDYSFDSENDNFIRAEAIAKELVRLSEYDYKDLYYKLQDSVEHNYQWLKKQVISQYGVPDIINLDNYYCNRVQESIRKCKLDL